jgi:hypothetical protein
MIRLNNIENKEAFIQNVEFRRDWNLPVTVEELEMYERLIKEREHG